jgi:hypothetical protein
MILALVMVYMDQWTDSSCRLSDYDKQKVLSNIFVIPPARDIQIFLSQSGAQELPQFKKIISKHIILLHGISQYKKTTCI